MMRRMTKTIEVDREISSVVFSLIFLSYWGLQRSRLSR